MKLLLPLLFLFICCTCRQTNTADYNQSHITYLSFSCENHLSIPYHFISVTIENRFDSITVHSLSKPLYDSAKWAYSTIDTSFTIDSTSFQQLVNMVTKITAGDVMQASTIRGEDGTDCTISYGHYLPSVAYAVWSPEYKTEQRRAQQFLVCKNAILKISKIDFERRPVK